MLTHASHDDTSAAPLTHGEWLHEPPEELDAPDELALDAADPLAPVPRPPHTLVFGTQSWSFDPSAPATAVQVRPDAHAACAQLGAQYSSPPNWPHWEPAAQLESCRQGGQATGAPPDPEALELDAPFPDEVDTIAPPLPNEVARGSPIAPHARRSAAGAATKQTARKCFIVKLTSLSGTQGSP